MNLHADTDKIITGFGLVARGHVAENVSAILSTRDANRAVPDNPQVWDQMLLERELPKGGKQALAVLIALWKRQMFNDELQRVVGTGHFNAVCRDLRMNFGFVFEGKRGYFYSVPDPARPGRTTNARRIVGWDASRLAVRPVRSDGKGREAMQKAHGGRCDIGGERGECEIDHRLPRSAALADNRPGDYHDGPTPDEVASGVADERFQVLCKKHNDLKREVCKACLNGGAIYVPHAFSDLYKSHRNGSCEGCFWFGRVTRA